MNTAYNALYINDARKIIAHSFDYAVKKMSVPLEQYVNSFINFKYISLIENGDPHYVAGISGIELAKEICNKQGIKYGLLEYNPGIEYWIGWILSYYQWSRNLKFKDILSKFNLERFKKAYPTFHECNEKRMFEYLDEIVLENKSE